MIYLDFNVALGLALPCFTHAHGVNKTDSYPYFLLLPHTHTHTHTHTQHTQLKFYAKVNNADDIDIDDSSLAAAVCEDEQNKEYAATAIAFFIICGLLFPIFSIILLAVIILSSRSRIGPVISEEQNHANLAALALTGLVFSTFVVVLDIMVLVVQEKHEFPTIHSNLIFITITTVLDAIAVLVAYSALAYIALACINALLHFRCHKCLKLQNVWLVILMCFAPLFCIVSHSGYIIVAWLSDTQHGGPAIFFYIISFLYYFIIFRQLYKFCNRKLPETRRCPKASFNPFIFFIEFLLGVILVGAEALVIYSLTALPVTVTTAPTVGSLASFPGRTRSANVFQLAFLIITGFFTYKFIYTEDEPKQFMNAFITYLRNKKIEDLDLNPPDAEAAGRVVGEVASTIIKRKRLLTNTSF